MSYSLNSLNGGVYGTIRGFGFTKGDTRSLDYSSFKDVLSRDVGFRCRTVQVWPRGHFGIPELPKFPQNPGFRGLRFRV